ncbi:cysteine desulfurase SufS [Pantoea sp. Aalb]|uniref:cysteine desulfurase SufS n=1 Tax=Pantoea sp. Aalb TaxID=2576762 RepID=UPI00132C8F55|nr:cysteine desulfurase SufS [Pantoea sp. Aalb]MXP67425.1 cysteine desulfurase SufS [Pantoea sp. Aalb]
MTFNLTRVRAEFPILNRKINGYPLAYLDSAASSQRPLKVITAESDFYQYEYAAVHRGNHYLSAQATTRIENIRSQVSHFINASFPEEIIFVKGTTEGINLVANSWGGNYLEPGDNIIITEMEHHSNIVPWQMIVDRTGIEIRILPINNHGELMIESLSKLIDKRTRLLAIAHISNVLGTINPIKKIVAKAKEAGVLTLVDGAQAVMHHSINVQDLDCDFYVFSSHKMYGPTGVGILYGRKSILDTMPPWEGGGAMLKQINLPTGTTWNTLPWRFEAGTPNIGGIIGFGAALEWINEIGLDIINKRETTLMNYALNKLSSIPDLVIYGPIQHRSGVIAFNLGKHHAFDVSSFLDQYGIAIRNGHHCAMPLMHHYAVSAMCRASLAIYNNEEEVDRLVMGLNRIHHLLDK